MKKNLASLVFPILLIFIFQIAPQSFAQQITLDDLVTYHKTSNFIKEFDIPIKERGLKGITGDNHGNVWFYHATNSSSKIIKMNADNKFEQYDIPGKTMVESPIVNLAGGQIVFDDSRNAVWFTDARTNSIGKLDLESGKIWLVEIPTPKSGPMGLALSNDKKTLWFTEILASKIARLDPETNKIVEYSTGNDSGPTFLAFDENGILWVTQSYAHNVIRIQTELLDSVVVNGMSSFTLPKPEIFSPFGIAVISHDGKQKMIVSDHGSSRVILSDLDSLFQPFTSYWTSPSQVYPQTLPGQIVTDKQGNVYFAQHGGNKITKIDANSGVMTEYDVPTGPLSTVLFSTVSEDGAKVWFIEWASNKIGYLDTTIPIPFNLNLQDEKITLDKSGSKTIDVTIRPENNSTLSTNEVELEVVGMTESGLSGIKYSANPQRFNQEQDVHKSEIVLNAENNAKPGTYTLMIESSSFESDKLRISQLYPVSIILDVPESVKIPSQSQDNKNVNLSSNENFITKYLALLAAFGLIAFIIYRRINKSKNYKIKNS